MNRNRDYIMSRDGRADTRMYPRMYDERGRYGSKGRSSHRNRGYEPHDMRSYGRSSYASDPHRERMVGENYEHNTPYGYYAAYGMYPHDYASHEYYDGGKDAEKEYYEELEEWGKDLEKYDIFHLPKEKVIEKAKQMGVMFKDFDEEEFYITYLMHISDYKSLHNVLKDPAYFIHMAKDFLEDEDAAYYGGEKLCRYMDYIAK
jgi:hypothetical protein